MPKDLAQTFQLLGLYDPKDGLPRLLSRIDVANIRPKDVYNAVLLRAPDNVAMATPGQGYDGRRHLQAALESPEFQRSSMRNFLQVFPDKRREIFVHIPKCAGTDLVLNLAPNRLSFAKVLTLEHWISKKELFTALSGLVRAAPFYDQVLLYGHVTVGEYVDICGVRSTDQMFTVVRDPVDLLLSQANYAATRLRQDPGITAPDTLEVATWLGIQKLQEAPTPDYWKELATKCLTDRRISQPNRICYYLGKEQVASYERAIEHVVTYDIEVTETSRYRRWLDERWNVQAGSRHNESEKLLTIQEARRFFPEELRAATSEDQKLYDVIRWVLQKTGKSSTSGSEIAEIAGRDGVLSLPEKLAQEKPASRPKIYMVQGNAAVEQLKAKIPTNSAGLRMAMISDYALHLEGNGGEITRSGWATPEAEFTWTNAKEAVVELPRPASPEDYILRIQGAPFVANGVLAAQRIAVLVNGEEVGSARCSEVAVLECDLPWSILDGHERIAITLQLPDAVQPSTIGRKDDRLLGFAVKSVALGRLQAEAEPEKTADAPASEPPPENLQQLALMFESIGENCEFGLVQRKCGAEPLGLFRFSSTPLPKLVKGLRSKFKGLGKSNNIEVQVSGNGREYMVLDKCFGFLFHAWVLVGELEPEEIAIRETRRLPLLVRKLVEEITLGEKIFVFHGMTPLSLEEARALSSALRIYGPTTLLWCELADEAHQPGTVERIEPGLLKGYMDRFAPGENAHDLSLDCWVTLCKNAVQVWRSA